MQALLQLGRLAQFSAAAVLFGLPAFSLYAIEADFRLAAGEQRSWRWIMRGAALLGLFGVLLWGSMQAVSMGVWDNALDIAAVWGVLSGMHVGRIALLRGGAMLLVLLVPAIPLRPRLRLACETALGAVIVASFAWSGHGGIPGGWIGRLHRGADVLHLLAAGLWIGGLVAFCAVVGPASGHLLPRDTADAALRRLRRALLRFSTVGSGIVAVIVATGLINTWLLVGFTHWGDLFETGYGVGLLFKLALFGGMLACAALNRFVLTPRLNLAGPDSQARRDLRRSIAAETLLALLVLGAISIIGTLTPPALSR